MSYTLTLDMSPDAVRFAERQASRRGMDFSALFVAFLRDKFGYEEDAVKGKTANAHVKDVGALTQSLSGVVDLPQGVSDKELLSAAMLEKYESMQ